MRFTASTNYNQFLPCPGLNWSRYGIVLSKRPGYWLWQAWLPIMASTVKNGIACLRKGNRRRRAVRNLTWRISVLILVLPLIGCFDFAAQETTNNDTATNLEIRHQCGMLRVAFPMPLQRKKGACAKGPVAYLTGTYPVFYSMKGVGVFLIPTECVASPTQGCPSA